MFAIDKPFISDFLLKTIRENKYPVLDTAHARELIKDGTINWVSEVDATNYLKTTKHPKVYSNSENIISWIDKNLSHQQIANNIKVFKDKVAFRKLLQQDYPDFFFRGLSFQELKNIDASSLPFPLVLKPSVGFFSIGVYIVNNNRELKQAVKNLGKEIADSKTLFPEEVLGLSEFILEKEIPGEEFAFDCYVNEDNEPVILNILHHIFPDAKATSDRVYSVSKKIVSGNLEKMEAFVSLIAQKTDVVNFPLHIEVRIDSNGKLVPIEINPMRFGGFCTTADHAWHAFGINTYEYFMEGKKPDWESIFGRMEDYMYNILVLDNNSGFTGEQIENFDYQKLANDFEHTLEVRKFDYRAYPLFGFIFARTSPDNTLEIDRINKSDLREYIVLKSG